jgi:GNAT superfamily N-acetyltransferase
MEGGDAAVEAMGDGVLVAMGPGRYVNRAIGVGPDLDDRDLDVIERFYAERGLPPSVQLSSWAGEATLERLTARGYGPRWFRSVFAATLPTKAVAAPVDGVEIVEVDDHNLDEWLDVIAGGNEIHDDPGRMVSDEFSRAAHGATGSIDLLALADGRAVGCGSLQLTSGVAVLGGAATLPGHRGRGVQGALLRHRLRLAATLGCSLVAVTAEPSGASARNVGRVGLPLVDTQVVVTAGGVG